MRITHDMILQNALRGVGRNLEALHRAQEEAVTGRRIHRVSDHPLDASTLMRLDSQLQAVEGYRRAGIQANTRLAVEEAVLTSVEDMVGRVKVLAVEASSTEDDGLREAAVEEIRELKRQIIALGNTVVGGRYIFGGGRTDTPPFLEDGSYAGDGNVHEVEIGEGFRVSTNHTGDEILSGVIDALDGLADGLESGAGDSVEAALSDLEEARQGVLRGLGEIGSRMLQIEETEDHLIARSSGLLDHRSEIQDADAAESALKLSQAQATLEQSYAALARVLSTNILQFLR
jgi:flagellar hook-associated protein 3 FlgL